MNNTVTFFGLASISFFGLPPSLPANAQIPQTSIQEILIEGEFNQVNQQLNQNLNLNFIYLPQIEESVIPTFNIQETFLGNINNQVNQTINQNALDFQLGETNLVRFDTNNFLNNDNILNGEQFIIQEAFIEGDNNSITQQSSQNLTDFIWLEQFTDDQDFNFFLNEILVSQELDSLQFGLQDTLILGDNNIVSQTIDQTLNSFIFTNNNFSDFLDTNTINTAIELDPIQFTIQETFVDSGQNTLISQNINQAIGDISFIDISTLAQNSAIFQQNNHEIVETSSSIDFDIDAFIDEILNSTVVEATQINRQQVRAIGNENTRTQENLQVLVVSVPEPNSFKAMGILFVIIGIVSCYKKR